MSLDTFADQDEVRILAPTGVCGSGFSQDSFELALGQRPHFIGCDAGSTDPGPEYLGTGRFSTSSRSLSVLAICA